MDPYPSSRNLDLHPFAMLVFTILTVVLFALVFSFIGALSGALIFDVSISDLANFEESLEGNVLSALKWAQIFGAIGTFILSGLLLSYLYTRKWFGFFYTRGSMNPVSIVILILIMLSSLPFVNFLTEMNFRMEIPFDRLESYFRGLEDSGEDVMMNMLKANGILGLLLNVFMIAVLPAIGEELIFRGLIQRHLKDWFRNPHFAIIVASIIFSLAHSQVYSFLPRFFLGLVLGYFYQWGKTIWFPVIAHFVNNALGVTFYYVVMNRQASEAADEVGTMELMPWTAAVSLLAVCGLMYLWVKALRTNQPPLPG